MFNSYYIGGNTSNNKCVVNLNQPSTGFIQKSNPVSRFIKFKRGSELESLLFPTDPREVPKLKYVTSERNPYVDQPWKSDYHREVSHFEEVVVLQICTFGDDYMLAEYVFKKDMSL